MAIVCVTNDNDDDHQVEQSIASTTSVDVIDGDRDDEDTVIGRYTTHIQLSRVDSEASLFPLDE